MANKDILEYLRETPHNTNVNVVKGMIGNSGGSSIEMTTIFDDDINLIYTTGGQFGNASGYCFDNISSVTKGFIKITYEDIEWFTISNTLGKFYFSDTIFDSELPFTTINVSNETYDDVRGNFSIYLYSDKGAADSDLETYCQIPHHLKIEWFIV